MEDVPVVKMWVSGDSDAVLHEFAEGQIVGLYNCLIHEGCRYHTAQCSVQQLESARLQVHCPKAANNIKAETAEFGLMLCTSGIYQVHMNLASTLPQMTLDLEYGGTDRRDTMALILATCCEE